MEFSYIADFSFATWETWQDRVYFARLFRQERQSFEITAYFCNFRQDKWIVGLFFIQATSEIGGNINYLRANSKQRTCFFASRGLDLHSAVLKIAVNHATWDAYPPKAFETWILGQCYGYYFLHCMWNIFSFGVMEAFDSKGIINTLEKYYVSQLECVDLATFPFATWQIRSCLLCKFISTEACLLSFPSIFRSFRQENRIVELFYWSKFRDRNKNEIFASQAKSMQGLRHW